MTVYFISGLGLHERAFKKIKIPEGIKPVYIKWLACSEDKSFAQYCTDIAAMINSSQPFALVGFSFGGIVAVELSKMLSPAKLIIISSVSTRKELPLYLRLFGFLKLYSILPVRSLNKASAITNWFNNVQNEADKSLINQIIKESDPHFIKWAMDKILNWHNTTKPGNLYHVHGKNDRLFPCSNVKADKVINGGGHFMVLTHADEINAILRAQLSAVLENTTPSNSYTSR